MATAASIASCGSEEVSGPPALRLGRDECAECGMIVSEDRSACAVLVEFKGRREHRMFDDIGCMLDYEHEPPEGVDVVEEFVHDHESGVWAGARECAFLCAPPHALPTPMASGIAAFTSRETAESTRAEVGGEVIDYAALAPARLAWKSERYGRKSDTPAP